jgi:hypothetical protein
MITSWVARLAGLLLVIGCTGADYECSETVACSLGSVCVDGSCVEQSCATSDQCGIEEYCDGSGSCVTGCQEDTDCMYGDYCDVENAECRSAECSDARLDCAFNEFCNIGTGECYDAGGYYCHDCDVDEDCGGNGNLCLNGGYCGVTCTTDSDCPTGYDCAGVSDISGNIIAYQCYTSCWLYEE